MISTIISTLAHIIIPYDLAKETAQNGMGGGYLGYATSRFLIDTFSRFLAYIIVFLGIIISFSLVSSTTLVQIKEFLSSFFSKMSAKRELKQIAPDIGMKNNNEDGDYIGTPQEQVPVKKPDDSIKSGKPEEGIGLDPRPGENNITKKDKEYPLTNDKDGETAAPKELYSNWVLPPDTLLDHGKPAKTNPEKHKQNATIIEDTLKSFGIHAKVAEISVGPRVVQYALRITVGTKVSKITSLGNDIALALAAPAGQVRIEAPIPGTSLVGIEMPNENPTLVNLGDVIRSKAFTEFTGKIPLVLGYDVTGDIIVKDLAAMPHLLIAGATNSGKSVCLHTILCGILMGYSPAFIKMILVDPKMIELPPYNNIPHLLTPVITDIQKVVYALSWLTAEMQKRFRILNKSGHRNIHFYNKHMGYPALPYIIFAVDEMADLMLTAGVDIEAKVVRLVQMARAVGIHLILSTQRPSVDILTGLIKANVPARIGLTVPTTIDSRVILDMPGAENLLGNGDMLFKAPDVSRPYRIQGAFVSPEETHKITKHIREQNEEDPSYNSAVTKPTSNGDTIDIKSSQAPQDKLFEDALRTVVHAQKASSSLLQRKLRIGYNRAARLMDSLYDAKVVSAQNGSKPRDVLISNADAFLQNYGDQDGTEKS
ncbi:MAG: DNA translocase FtsK [Patescibacteria group bacterium]|nr:DNA translocase FtsK [Patescibacteria group bacterium]